MSAVVTQQRQLRAFLTQSAHSTGASTRRPATATATLGGFESIFDDTDLAQDATRPATSNSAMIRLAATVDDARSKMSSLKRVQLIEAEQLTRLSRRSDELRNYNRERFMDRMKAAETNQQRACKSEPSPPRPATSKCFLSAYVTVPKPVDVGDTHCCEAASTPEELLNGRSRTRAQLMSQLRLHQTFQPVRFRHDRTAQELAQEGCLPSRNLCEAFPWQPGYKYTPYPTPKLLAWTKYEAERRLERQRLAEEFDRVETPLPKAATPPTPSTSPPILLMPPPPPPPIAEPSSSLLVPPLQAGEPQQQRPKSGRAKPTRRGHQKHHHKEQQQQLTPEQQALLLEQQLAEKAAARRRNFSVSTIGEEELAPALLEQQRLTEVCQRLRDRRVAREVAAAAAAAEAAAAEAALKAAAEAASAPAEPPVPPTPPQPLQSDEKSSKKKRGGSAGSGKKKRPAAGQEKQKKKTQPKSPRSASSGSEKGSGAKKKQVSATPSRSSSVSSDSGKPTDERKKKLSSQQQPKQKKTGSPRAKSPKGGKKAPASKKGKATAQKQLQKAPLQPPPQPTLETELIEPAGPDPIDLLADEIEAAEVFHRTKAPGELPDFPCPSSEEKSRQQLTKVWWQRRAVSNSGVSVIT